MDRILRRSLGVSETAPTDTRVKPAPPVASEPIEEQEFDFDDTHVRLDPEALGLKTGEPVVNNDDKEIPVLEEELVAPGTKAEVEDDSAPEVEWTLEDVSEEAQKPLGHDEL